MFGCCGKERTIFRDKDGAVLQTWLAENYPVNSKVQVIPNTTSSYSKHVFKMTGKYPTETKVVDPEGKHHDFCTCPCHIDGLSVMC